MANNSNYITLKEICLYHQVEESFLYHLEEYELLSIRRSRGKPEIHFRELPKLERMLRLHRELEINVEGIQSVLYLLERMEGLRQELMDLRRKLDRFEGQ